MPTAGILFAGGGVAEARLTDLVDVRWAVEYDPAIAGVYRANHGDRIIVGDVRAQDYAALGHVDWLHASPVCTRASNANTGATEAPEDVETAQAVVRALHAVQPGVFTLENVWKYRTFEAFRIVCQALEQLGYWFGFDHLNSADFGVPQTRKRLILRATRDRMLPALPQATPWRGWYEAVEDLIPTLPDTTFARWQIGRLPAELAESMLFNNHFGDPAGNTLNSRRASEPSQAVTTLNPMRAFLVSNAATQRGDGLRADREPAFAVTTNQQGRLRAWIDTGRVVLMTPQCLARFQSIPNSYLLPFSSGLAARVVGNGWPSEMARRIVLPLLALDWQ